MKNRFICYLGNIPVFFGDVVECDSYVVKSKKYFQPNYKKGILELRDQDNKVIEEIASGCVGEISRYELKTLSRPFRGICVGVTARNVSIHGVLDEDVVNTWSTDCKPFAIVYYANNKKRLVPLDEIISVIHAYTLIRSTKEEQ